MCKYGRVGRCRGQGPQQSGLGLRAARVQFAVVVLSRTSAERYVSVCAVRLVQMGLVTGSAAEWMPELLPCIPFHAPCLPTGTEAAALAVNVPHRARTRRALNHDRMRSA